MTVLNRYNPLLLIHPELKIISMRNFLRIIEQFITHFNVCFVIFCVKNCIEFIFKALYNASITA
ncbi:hypothetical protein N478_23965 [Pseudoalteromonas luteoviolacea S4060-1]|uniref:Uncharacterized protein n=1 Tax=Pseudoalteromonas luteoviolacea S4060-1 TaxID=1365257 RepID=A0A162AYB6_9GAMM|nr:hypothetical protein N478_23965 [Pseudoalteromonas luteoviolacea S4060-1]